MSIFNLQKKVHDHIIFYFSSLDCLEHWKGMQRRWCHVEVVDLDFEETIFSQTVAFRNDIIFTKVPRLSHACG